MVRRLGSTPRHHYREGRGCPLTTPPQPYRVKVYCKVKLTGGMGFCSSLDKLVSVCSSLVWSVESWSCGDVESFAIKISRSIQWGLEGSVKTITIYSSLTKFRQTQYQRQSHNLTDTIWLYNCIMTTENTKWPEVKRQNLTSLFYISGQICPVLLPCSAI